MSTDQLNGSPSDGVARSGSVEQLIETLTAQGVRTIRVSHCDLYGRCRSKDLPVARLGLAVDGLGFCLISMLEDLHGNPLEALTLVADGSFPDMRCTADTSTARILPWARDTAWFLSDLCDDRDLSPRGALARTVSRLDEVGLTALVAPELEFYLLERRDGTISRYGAGAGLAYTVGRRADPIGALSRIHRALDELGLDVTTAHHEFSPGQFEINLHHGPALDAADRAFLFKESVKELAASEALEANFMAKPFNDAEGSSLHVHVSLLRGERSAFAEGEHGLSEDLLAFMAGVLAHADALTALGCPTVNSYRRLVPEAMAPTRADWGHDHRFTYVRVPPERGAGTRIEVRGGDASANPYLLLSGLLLAGLDGICRGLTPGRERSPGGESPGHELPSDLGRALDALEADSVLLEGLGPELIHAFVALKRNEIDRERRHVNDWEWAEYSFHS